MVLMRLPIIDDQMRSRIIKLLSYHLFVAQVTIFKPPDLRSFIIQ